MSYNDPLHLISIQSFSQLEQISSNHQVIKNVFLYCYVAQAVHHSLRLGHTSPFDCCSPPRFWDSHNGRKIVKLRESTSSSCSWTRRYSTLYSITNHILLTLSYQFLIMFYFTLLFAYAELFDLRLLRLST